MFLFRKSIDTTKIPSLVLVGDGGTGKSSLFERLTCVDKKKYKFNKKYIATEEFNLNEIIFETNHGPLKIHVWDTAGQEKFGKLRSAYVHKADMCIIMYDSIEPKTKENVDYWLKYLLQYCKSYPPVAVCGNKKDKMKNVKLLNTVHLRQTVLDKKYNYSNSISNRLISVKNNDNIKQTIEWLLSKHYGTGVELQ
jgi:small GTP-binding protein